MTKRADNKNTNGYSLPPNFKPAKAAFFATLPDSAFRGWDALEGFPNDPNARLSFIDRHLSSVLAPRHKLSDNLRQRLRFSGADDNLRADLNKYRGWLLNKVANLIYAGLANTDLAYRLPEDLPKLADDLYLHHKHLSRSPIHTYKTLTQLRDATAPFHPAYSFDPSDRLQAYQRFVAEDGGTGEAIRLDILPDGTEVIVPVTHAASRAFASPRWCTGWESRRHFDSYKPLLIFIDPAGARWQTNRPSGQYCDANDANIGLNKLPPPIRAYLEDGAYIDRLTERLLPLLQKLGSDHPQSAVSARAIARARAAFAHIPISLPLSWVDALLQEAAVANTPLSIRRLLDAGADIHTRDDQALHLACSNGHAEVVRLLIGAGADIRAKHDRPLCAAAAAGCPDTLRVLLEAGADVHAQNNQALRCAAATGHSDTVRLLIDAGADIHALNDMAILRATQYGHQDVVRLLLEAGANVHARNDEPLRLAISNGDELLVRLLIDAGADPVAAADNSRHPVPKHRVDLRLPLGSWIPTLDM